MEKYITQLSKCRLFDGICSDNISAMLGCLAAKTRKYNKEQAIFSEGDLARYLGIVLSGKAQIERIDIFGNRTILARVEPYQMFGESFVCADVEAIPVSVVAATDSDIMLIDARRITLSCSNACNFHSRLVFNLLKVVAEKNIIFNEKLEVTSKRTTREKLMTYLQIQAQKADCDTFVIPFNRQELADYLEVERCGLSAEISKMRKDGIIENTKNIFKLLR
ncbi:MAG: Crp/Fnr family transcriptional regulator [Clostridia bacterium]|nr:Crp/Fnr family transcriptional regulator [Clostridia bacterium]